MNKKRKSDAIATTTAAAVSVYSAAWSRHMTLVGACSLILVHILSFVCNDTDAVKLVCKKWHRWGYYATFERDWKRNQAATVPLSRLHHVLEFEPQLALRSAFAHYMMVHCCSHGRAKMVETLLGATHIDKVCINRIFILRAVWSKNAATVRTLLADERADPTVEHSLSLSYAVQINADEIVAVLLADKRADPSVPKWRLFDIAVDFNRCEIVRLLLKDRRCIPTYRHMRAAVQNESTKILSLFLSDGRVDPTAQNHYALRCATKYNDTASILALMADGRADPTIDNYMPVITTASHGCKEGVQAMLRDRRVNRAALTAAIDATFNDDSPARRLLYAAMEAE